MTTDTRDKFGWDTGDVQWHLKFRPLRTKRDVSDEERDDHGRWASGGGTEPGRTDTGNEGNRAVGGTVLHFTQDANHRDDVHASESAAALKQANAIDTGKTMLAAAASDPKLAAQLEAAGQRVLALPVDPPPTVTHDANGVTTTYTPVGQYEVMFGRLGFESPEDVDPKEVGARYIADQLQSTWSATSSNSKPESIAVQMAVADRFGLGSAASDVLDMRAAGQSALISMNTGADVVQALAARFGVSMYGTETPREQGRVLADSPAIKAYVEATYQRTQEQLKDTGITDVTLHRGMTWMSVDRVPTEIRNAPSRATVTVAMAPLSSWSTSPRIADEQFARKGGIGVVLTSTVSANRIFAIPSSGPGCLGEQEVLVVGGRITASVQETASTYGSVDWDNLDTEGVPAATKPHWVEDGAA